MRLSTVFDHLILCTGAVVMILPAVALFFSTTHEPGSIEAARLTLVPGTHGLENYERLLAIDAGFKSGITATGLLWNSFLLAAVFAGMNVTLALLAAYGLVYFRPRFASLIFWLLLATLMLPLESRFLATHAVVAQLGLTNSLSGLVGPLLASGVGTFFFRNFLNTVPDTLLEAARLDRAGPFLFLKDVLVPLSAPMAAALFLVAFVTGWNQYLWPVMVTSDEAHYTIVRGLQYFGAASLTGKTLAILALLPPALLVIFFQRQVVKGLYDGNH